MPALATTPSSPPKRSIGRLHGGAVALARGQVGLERLARPVRSPAQVHRQHLRAVRLQSRGDRPPDPAGRAGHQCSRMALPTRSALGSAPDGARGKAALGAVGGAADRLEDGALHASRAASRITRSCGAGRSRTSRASGARSGTSTRSGPPPERVLGERRRCPAPSGFRGRELNYAEYLLPRRARGGDGDRARERVEPAGRAVAGTSCAMRWRAAPPGCGAWAWAAATAWSRTCRTWPRRSIAFLATASLGAIWSSCAPEFGTPTVVDRFARSSRRC